VEDESWWREKLRWGVAEPSSAFCTEGLMGGGQSKDGSGRRW
jgi:hypothetical protein